MVLRDAFGWIGRAACEGFGLPLPPAWLRPVCGAGSDHDRLGALVALSAGLAFVLVLRELRRPPAAAPQKRRWQDID